MTLEELEAEILALPKDSLARLVARLIEQMEQVTITITEDEALVLFEFFARFGDTDNLSFAHAAEYIALMKISGQIDRSTSAMFKPEYGELLEAARQRIAVGFEGDVPGMDTIESLLSRYICILW